MKGLKKFISLTAIVLSVLFSLCIAFFTLVVCLRNSARVDIDVIFATYPQVPIEMVVLICFAVGIVFGSLLSVLFYLTCRQK